MTTIERAETVMNRDYREDYIASLEAFILLQRDTMDVVNGMWNAGSTYGHYYHPRGDIRADLAGWIRAMMARGAKIEKEYPTDDEAGSTVTVSAMLPDGMRVRALVGRADVCERVIVGEREVTETVPDPEQVAKVPLVEVTHTVTDYRWECSPMLDGER